MQDVKGRMPAPRLQDALSELVRVLDSDDWCRYSTEDGSQHYYEMGFKAAQAGRNGDASFVILEWPKPQPTSPIAKWYSRSQLAAKQPNYVQEARRRLESFGVPASAIDAVEDQLDFSRLRWNAAVTREQRFEALHFFLQSLNISTQKPSDAEMDDGERNEIEVGRQKWYLREMANKFRRLADESCRLDPLDFHDAQLEEASRCFLYGFFRAAVVLSASAVEKCLKEAINGKAETYSQLVDLAFWNGKLGKSNRDLAEPTKALFEKRNRVVHNDWNPPEHEAGEILAVAREVVEHLKGGLN